MKGGWDFMFCKQCHTSGYLEINLLPSVVKLIVVFCLQYSHRLFTLEGNIVIYTNVFSIKF